MSESESEPTGGIPDEQLPEDLAPGEDNPLAAGLDDGELAADLAPGELLSEGKTAEETSDTKTDDPDEASEDS